MTLQQLARWEALTLCHPTPWVLDQANLDGVCVKDNVGNVVFYDDFGSIPDEMPTTQAEWIRAGATALAIFLVEFSTEPHGKPLTQTPWS